MKKAKAEGKAMILLEGNIGAGKSTLGRSLAASGLCAFIEEPVEQWREGFSANLLDLFYTDPQRWAFTFQVAAFTTRAKTWDEVLTLTDYSLVVLERSIFTDRYVFAKAAAMAGNITETEWQIYLGLWDFLASNWAAEPDCVLYYRTPAEICMERIVHRNRSEEAGVSLDYLIQLEELHDAQLLSRRRTVMLDGTEEWDPMDVWKLVKPFLRV